MGTHMPFHPNREYIERFAPDFLGDKEAQRYLQRFNSDVLGWLTPVSRRHGRAPPRRSSAACMTPKSRPRTNIWACSSTSMRTSGALDNTLVLIVADHGEHLGDKHFIGHTVSLYNELIHVPLIVRDPSGDLPRGATVDQPVSTRRLFHTALDRGRPGRRHAAGLFADAYWATHDPDHGVVFAEAITAQNVQNIMKKHKPELIERTPASTSAAAPSIARPTS